MRVPPPRPGLPFGHIFGGRIADRIATELLSRLEDENALPLPTRAYDVVVDDPEMSGPHILKGIVAVSARAAGVEAYRQAMRAEGYRCHSAHPDGDEVTVEVASREVALYSYVFHAGKNPRIAKIEAQQPVSSG